MTLQLSATTKNSFAVATYNAHFSGEHDAALSGDALSSISLNYEWRRVLVHAIYSYRERIGPEDYDAGYDEFIRLTDNLLVDLYT